MKILFAALALLLSACASYEAQPLEDQPAVLETPDIAALQQDAVDRPALADLPVDLSGPLGGKEIAALAVLANPDLKALRARAGVADAQVFAAGLLPDPTFDAGLDHIVSGPDPVDNLAGALGLDINALRTKSVREQRARAQARQARMDLAWAEWQTAGDARIQAARLAIQAEIAELAAASRDAARTLLDRTLKAAARGDVDGGAIQAARLGAADAEQQAQQAARDLATARQQLNRLLGLPPGYHLDVKDQALPPDIPDTGRLYATAVAMRPDLQALRAGYAAQEAAVHKAVLDQFPDLSLTINASRDTGRNVLIGPAVNFTLPLWNRNRGGIAIERATRAALKAEYEARLFQTRADIAAAGENLSILRPQYADLAGGLPAIRKFAEASRAAAQRGDISEAAAKAAEQALRDRRLLLLQTRLAMTEQDIALELLAGATREQWK